MLNFKIIAVDFDGTLCENKWPEIGEPNLELINHIKQEKAAGAKLILWTCRVDELLSAAIRWCDKNHQLQFDMINGNLPEVIKEFGSDTRKIFAHEYIDDKMCGRFGLPYKTDKQLAFTDSDIQNVENFLSKVDPVIEFLEMQSIVRMQYDIYKRMMMPVYIQTSTPVKLGDAKSGLFRRIIPVSPQNKGGNNK